MWQSEHRARLLSFSLSAPSSLYRAAGAADAAHPRAYEYPDGTARPYNSDDVDTFNREIADTLGNDNISLAWTRVVNEVFALGKKIKLEGQLSSVPSEGKGIQKLGTFEVIKHRWVDVSVWTEPQAWLGTAHLLVRRVAGPALPGMSQNEEFSLNVSYNQYVPDNPDAPDEQPIDEGPQCYTLTGDGLWSLSGMAKPFRHGAYHATLWTQNGTRKVAEVCVAGRDLWRMVRRKMRPRIRALSLVMPDAPWPSRARERVWKPGGAGAAELFSTAHKRGFKKESQRQKKRQREEKRKLRTR